MSPSKFFAALRARLESHSQTTKVSCRKVCQETTGDVWKCLVQANAQAIGGDQTMQTLQPILLFPIECLNDKELSEDEVIFALKGGTCAADGSYQDADFSICLLGRQRNFDSGEEYQTGTAFKGQCTVIPISPEDRTNLFPSRETSGLRDPPLTLVELHLYDPSGDNGSRSNDCTKEFGLHCFVLPAFGVEDRVDGAGHAKIHEAFANGALDGSRFCSYWLGEGSKRLIG